MGLFHACLLGLGTFSDCRCCSSGTNNKQHLCSIANDLVLQTWDAFDFFTTSLTVTDLAKEFGKTKTDITWGITLVLMFRSVGSILFGIAADRYGRKWPFVVNNLLFVVLELVCILFLFFLRSSILHLSRKPTAKSLGLLRI